MSRRFWQSVARQCARLREVSHCWTRTAKSGLVMIAKIACQGNDVFRDIVGYLLSGCSAAPVSRADSDDPRRKPTVAKKVRHFLLGFAALCNVWV